MGYRFITDCVNAPASFEPSSHRDGEDVRETIDNARKVTRRTFLRLVDRESLAEVENALGYESHPSRGLTMAGDWYVGYFKSTYQGSPCVFFRVVGYRAHVFV